MNAQNKNTFPIKKLLFACLVMGFIWPSSVDSKSNNRDLAFTTIEKLTDRLKTARLMEDRKTAVVSLKGYARSYLLVRSHLI